LYLHIGINVSSYWDAYWDAQAFVLASTWIAFKLMAWAQGLGDRNDRASVRRIEFLEGIRVVQVTAGEPRACIVLLQTNYVL
jgi:hypothetical protein